MIVAAMRKTKRTAPIPTARSRRSAPPSSDPIALELSPSQVDQIMRAATGSGSLTALLSQTHDVGTPLDVDGAWMEDLKLSRSLLHGLIVLAALPADGSYVGNAELARMAGFTSSTTHRYLKTLVVVGLAERDRASRKYRLTRPHATEHSRGASR